MAVAVADLDVGCTIGALTRLEAYTSALVLFRLGGLPVGQAWLPVSDGMISAATISAALPETVMRTLRRQRLDEYLGQYDEPLPAPAERATIAICTRDRPADLQRCLDSLMRLPDDGQEVLVVDNSPSSDATAHVVAGYARVRYVCEPRPGLNNARNRALAEASHDIVAFIDDDAVADAIWLRGLLRNFAGPLTCAVTGLTMPVELETPAQEWFERHSSFGRGFERMSYNTKRLSPTSAGMVGSGVNMALRRSLLHTIGPFNDVLDAGTPTRSGGDNDMFTRILAAGYEIVYDPAALNWHRHRRSWGELRQALYGYGVGVYAAYTHSLLVLGELGVFKSAWGWFRYRQLPTLIDTLLRRAGHEPIDLVLTELRGCFAGPAAYLQSCRQRRARKD